MIWLTISHMLGYYYRPIGIHLRPDSLSLEIIY